MLKPLTSSVADALLRPKSVALVGISDDSSKTASRPLRFLRAAGYQGTIYNVNPSRSEVQGEKAYPSLSALPEVPEHAFILTNSDLAVSAIEECGRLGIPVATILAGGFSESGEEGKARELKLLETAERTGVRILGPSSLGVVNLHESLILTANAAFAEPDLPTGGIFCASHSGSMLGALVSRGKSKNVGFAGLISVGSETNISIGSICESTLDDPKITGYMLFLESLHHANDLRRFALAAAKRGKPVVAYKLGSWQFLIPERWQAKTPLLRPSSEIAVSHALKPWKAFWKLFRCCHAFRWRTLASVPVNVPLSVSLPPRVAVPPWPLISSGCAAWPWCLPLLKRWPAWLLAASRSTRAGLSI